MEIWALCGHRGAGKSLCASLLASVIASLNRSVLLVGNESDSEAVVQPADDRQRQTLHDLIQEKTKLDQSPRAKTQDLVRRLRGHEDLLDLASPDRSKSDGIRDSLLRMSSDYVLVELEMESSARVLDFFNLANRSIAVLSPDIASMQLSYKFVEAAVFRRLQLELGVDVPAPFFSTQVPRSKSVMELYEHLCDRRPDLADKLAGVIDAYRPFLLLNGVRSPRDVRIVQMIQSVAKRLLNVDLQLSGSLPRDSDAIHNGTRSSRLGSSGCELIGRMEDIAAKIMSSRAGTASLEHAATESRPLAPVTGLNDNVPWDDHELHVQTEDLGSPSCIVTQVFLSGHIVHSIKSTYPSELRSSQTQQHIANLMRKQHFQVIQEILRRKVKILLPA